MTTKINSFVFLIVVLAPVSSLFAGAACCSAAGYSPNIIQGDERALFSFSFDWSQKAAQSNSSGEILSSNFDEDHTLGGNISGTLLAADYFQFGLDFGFARRNVNRNETSATSWGPRDLHLIAAYEALPQYTYEWWRPRVFVFSSLSAPLGNSMYDSTETLQADALSEGFWSTGLGIFAVQIWGPWSLNYTGSGRYRFDRKFNQTNGSPLKTKPGFTTSHQVSGTYRFRPSRWSVSSLVGWGWKSGVKTEDDLLIFRGGNKISTDVGVAVNYAFSDTQGVGLSYTDQSLIPISQNADLNRIVALSYNWGVFR